MVERPCLFSRKYQKKRTQNTVLYTVKPNDYKGLRGRAKFYAGAHQSAGPHRGVRLPGYGGEDQPGTGE